jgi:hypothetical protein
LVIDRSRGFTVSRMEHVSLDGSGNVRDVPRINASAEWDYRDSAWVPVSIAGTMHHLDGSVFSYEFDLDWRSVNPPQIDAHRFRYESFEGVWNGTHVFERRPGRREYLDTISGNAEEIRRMLVGKIDGWIRRGGNHAVADFGARSVDAAPRRALQSTAAARVRRREFDVLRGTHPG